MNSIITIIILLISFFRITIIRAIILKLPLVLVLFII